MTVEIDGCTIVTRRAGGANRAYRYALGLAAAKFAHVFNAEVRDDFAVFAANEEVQMSAWAQTCAVSWEGVEGRDGQPLPFSKEAALDLVRSCPSVWDEIKGAAIDSSRFKPDKTDGEMLGES